MLQEEAEERVALGLGQPIDARGEVAVHEQQTATSLGVDPHHGMMGRFAPVVAADDVAELGQGGVQDRRRVLRGKVLEELLHRRRQGFVHAVHAGPAGITAHRGKLHGAQDRAQRRLGQVRRVRVPALRVLAAWRRLVEHGDAGLFGRLRVDHRHHHRGEALGEGQLLCRGDLLVSEEEHEVIQ